MSNDSQFESLDQAIQAMLAGKPATESASGATFQEMLRIAEELRCAPRPKFMAQLKLELEWQASGRSVTSGYARERHTGSRLPEILPTLSGSSTGIYPLRGSNLAASAVLHAFLLVLLGMGLLTAHRAPQILRMSVDPAPLSLSAYEPHKGTGGGDRGGGGPHDRLNVSRGALPDSARLPLSVPVVRLQDQPPRLAVRASIISPPDLNLPHTGVLGDPLSSLLTPSGGTGLHGGLGSGDGGGVGSEHGPRFGGGAFGPGNGVSWPRAIYHPEPEFSEEARRSHYQGVVSLLIVVGADGRAHDIRVLRALGMGLDEKAQDAVRTWLFEPGKKDGRPVSVLMEVDIDFRIH